MIDTSAACSSWSIVSYEREVLVSNQYAFWANIIFFLYQKERNHEVVT